MSYPDNNLARLEDKVDALTDAINKLVLIEERQTVQGAALIDLTKRVTATEQVVDRWINRGVGVWAVVACSFAVFKVFA
jgi:hypothetical protein